MFLVVAVPTAVVAIQDKEKKACRVFALQAFVIANKKPCSHDGMNRV